jgi:DNA repair exonuclease SbcCD ATPase subunit
MYLNLENKFNHIKDLFIQLKFKLNEKITKCESLMNEKENLNDAQTGKEIAKKHKIENEIDALLNEIDSDLKQLETELKAQKKKKDKYPDTETKEEILEKLKEKVQILKSKYKGEEFSEEELIGNKSALEQLENLLEERKKSSSEEDGEERRDLTEEEKNKINEWKKKVKEQDGILDDIYEGVVNIKEEAIRAGEGIETVGKKVKKLHPKVDKTTKKIKTQNERLKELVNEIRSSDKICCDIILILIFLGLICVLYSVIKHKFIKK